MPGYGKYRSPEEKEEFVKQLDADAKQRVIDLAENWEADAKDVAEFLIFSSRFPDYSVRNQMLIYKQNPYAMFTAGYNQFEKMGYTVQKGEKGMRIWIPAKAVHSVSLKQTLYPLCLNPPWVCQSLTHVRST